MPRNTVQDWISDLDPALLGHANAVLDLVRAATPGLTETVKWGNPVWVGNRNVCYLAAGNGYVSLGFFRGASLSDPAGIVEGSGKTMRHVKVRAGGDMPKAELVRLIQEAIALDSG